MIETFAEYVYRRAVWLRQFEWASNGPYIEDLPWDQADFDDFMASRGRWNRDNYDWRHQAIVGGMGGSDDATYHRLASENGWGGRMEAAKATFGIDIDDAYFGEYIPDGGDVNDL